MNNLTTEQSIICGLPGFRNQTAVYNTYDNTTMSNYSDCNGAAAFFPRFCCMFGLGNFDWKLFGTYG